ncbi:hypothetical protein OG21DRAFT_595033 [Imleria badia]|nr:hypothetical protein OG21DRAFT_595033 [Imleria badia]
MLGAVPSRHPKYRTKLCRNVANGGCPFGQKCSFLHPAPRITDPSSFARNLFSWNPLLLPQLLALSNQQGTQKMMPRRSPPPPQRPQLIDEDLSPSTSLLLSKSDSTSLEQVPQTRQSSRRKKYSCRHFIRTGGWCPAGGQCKFHHDVAALPSAGVRKAERAPPSDTDAHGEGGRTISGGVLMGIQSPSPPIVSQAHLEPRHTEAELTQPYQPMYWPNYTWQTYQPYYAAVPIRNAAPSSVVQHSAYPYPPSGPPPPPPQPQTVPPSNTQTSLPLGSYEVNGTTYFPSAPSLPTPPPVTYSMPVHPVPYNHTAAPAHPYYAPPTLPAGYYDISTQTRDVGPPTSFDPFASDPMLPSELPVIPRLEDYQISPIQQDVLPLPLSSPSALMGDLGLSTTPGKPTVAQEHEFPYRPPKDQRVGHARRISVNIKRHARVSSG